MHLNKKAFANSFALVTAIVMIIFWLLQMVAPAAFVYIFNAQFMGADVASLSVNLPAPAALGVIITMAIVGWVMGWLIAHFYNRFAR